MKKLFFFFILILCIFTFVSPTVFADDITFLTPTELVPHAKTIDRVQSYLSNLTTVIADFTQVAPDGTLTSGKFYLKRPGKMRWQYNPPTPILMISSGTELVYYDIELEQVSHIPLDDTLIGFLAQNPIAFDKNIGIIGFNAKQGVIRITLAQRDKPDDGQLELEFSDKPLLIRNMVITDATHQTTSVSLNNARFGVELDPELFIFRDPRTPRKIH
jgi:outer membrane lipoprotein-sorting protein